MPVKSLFENTMGNPFLTLLNIDQNSSKIDQKLILKADLKRECPYFYSKLFS